MKISRRINLNIAILSFVSVVLTSIVIGYMSYSISSKSLESQVKDELEIFRDMKAIEIENYFKEIQSEILSISSTNILFSAVRDFKREFDNYSSAEIDPDNAAQFKLEVIDYYSKKYAKEFENRNGIKSPDSKKLINFLDDAAFALQYHYILKNPFSATEKNMLEEANDRSQYSVIHKKYHNYFKKVKDKLGFYDIFLIDLNGRVIYTVEKELDFAASMNNSLLRNTQLSKAFTAALSSDDVNFTMISDFSAHLPSFNEESAFISTPIITPAGEKLGVLVFQISADEINNIMTSNNSWKEVGLGNTGEVYLVGEDLKSRSISRFVVQDFDSYYKFMEKADLSSSDLVKMAYRKNNVGIQKNDTKGVESSLSGSDGFEIYKDYRGISVLSSYKPLNIPGLNWVILAEMDKSEAFAPANAIAKKIVIYVLLVCVVMMVISYIVGSSLGKFIVSPIRKFSKAIVAISKDKDLTRRIESHADDEFIDMANSINKLIISFQSLCKETLESTAVLEEKSKELQEIFNDRESVDEKESNANKKEGLNKVTNDLNDLKSKMNRLSSEFRFLEKESERRSDW